jgi:hypothetical protein
MIDLVSTIENSSSDGFIVQNRLPLQISVSQEVASQHLQSVVDNSVQNANSGGIAHDICESVSFVERSAERSLFNVVSVISEQLIDPRFALLENKSESPYYEDIKLLNNYNNTPEGSAELESYFHNDEICRKYPLVQELIKAKCPQVTINSLLRCGVETGEYITKSCGCGQELIALSYHCSNRSCPRCALIRSKRLRKKYMPMLESYPVTRGSPMSLYFLSISPQNYSDFKEGLEHIKSSWKKFLRSPYVSQRVKAGLWVIEAKSKNKFGQSNGWNVHIHALFYGRRLDNVIRGRCEQCNQNILKLDKETGKLRCANRNCKSFDVNSSGDSKIVRIFKEVSGLGCMINVQEISSAKSGLFYVLKYISSNKDDFASLEDQAKYITQTRRQKLVNVFGEFFKFKVKKSPCVCWRCQKEITWDYGIESSCQLGVSSIPPPVNNIALEVKK